MLVGFTDDVGAFDSNRELSQERAEQVLAELQQRAGDRLQNVNLTYRGFGEVAPTACNQEDRGRAINRRVEVWIQAAR
jgi:phosphate transport system substrate-binding protein